MFSQKKPYSAVTVTIETLTSEAVPVDDLSGIPDLVEIINIQDTGPREASRAIRKKLKYGNLHRQLRALTILDGLIQNAGSRFQRTFADEALLERLRFCGTAELSDPDVKKKCRELFAGWAAEYKNTPGMGQVAKLHRVAILLRSSFLLYSCSPLSGNPSPQTSCYAEGVQGYQGDREPVWRRGRRRRRRW
jgi:hypothetical protein